MAQQDQRRVMPSLEVKGTPHQPSQGQPVIPHQRPSTSQCRARQGLPASGRSGKPGPYARGCVMPAPFIACHSGDQRRSWNGPSQVIET